MRSAGILTCLEMFGVWEGTRTVTSLAGAQGCSGLLTNSIFFLLTEETQDYKPLEGSILKAKVLGLLYFPQPFIDLPSGKKQRFALVLKPKGRHQFLVKKRTWTKLFCDRTRGCSELMRPHLQIGNGSQHQQTIWPTPLTQKYMNHPGCSGKNQRDFLDLRKLLVFLYVQVKYSK